MSTWDKLSMAGKQKLMQEYIERGITDLDSIKDSVDSIDLESPRLEEANDLNLDYSNLDIPVGLDIPNYGEELAPGEFPDIDWDALAVSLENIDDDTLKEYYASVREMYKQKNL